MGFGNKGETSSPPPVQTQEEGMDMEMLMGFMGMMESMAAGSQQQQIQPPSIPQMPQVPEVQRSPEVDWAEKQQQLANKMKAENELDNQRKKGRIDTIYTGSLLEDDPVTSSSILTGKT